MEMANWWMLEMMAHVSEHPNMTHSECLENTIPEIQREAAEEMRKRIHHTLGKMGITTDYLEAIDALPLLDTDE